MPIRRWTMIFLTILLLGMLAACGENAADGNVGEFKGVPNVAVGGSGGASGNDITVDSAEGGTLKFAQETLAASTGKIKVTFNSKAIPGLFHNWVLVKPGEEDAAVAESVAPDFVPTKTFIAHTDTVDGGKSTTTEFEVAEAGTYSYLCTYPGHYAAGMKGTMTVAAGSGGEAAGGGAAAGGGTELVSNSAEGGTLKFAEEALTAPAGEIKVTFNSKAIPGLFHNWVLVKPGEEDAAVAESVAPDFVPTKTFIAHTKTINGGETDSTTFTVEPGTYSFICTYPGHYAAGMKGTLTVE